MNRRMIAEYLKTMIFAILTSVVLTLLLCFFLFFNGKAVDGDMPQYLIHSIGQSVHVEADEGENVSVDEAAIESLRKYKAWLQVIDADGQVIHGEFVPADIPTQYTMVQLVDGVMRSDRIPGYTLFVGGVPEYPELAVIIGCDSELISKFSIELEGGGDSVLVRCLIIFLLTSVCVIIFAALRFAKKVTVPVTTVIDNIGQISKGQFVENKASNPLFGEVFSQLDRLQDELQENERTRAEWISNISHDIKTPLSTVKGYSEMLSSEDYEFEPAEVRAYAGEVCNAEGVIEGLVEELRISQMLVEGKLRINKEDVKLHELLEECVEASWSCKKDEDEIVLSCAEDILLSCDRKLMKRCLVNIICNAFVHNQSPIQLRIEARAQGEADTVIGVELVIADNGKGMTTQEREHIFERYYRGTNSGQTKGTGLGLAIAREAVLAHDGEIEVVSEEGKGTKFIIRFAKAAL